MAVQSDDFGKDLPSVQALLRKHDAAERDLLALQEKVSVLTEDGARMRQSHPDDAAQIDEKLVEVTRRWEALRSRATARKQRLDDSQLVHRFLSEYRDLIGFIHDTQGKLSSSKNFPLKKRRFFSSFFSEISVSYLGVKLESAISQVKILQNIKVEKEENCCTEI